MADRGSQAAGYLMAALLGAVGGGLAVVLATRAIPGMLGQMMQRMMTQMREEGCDPAEM
jgi:hypothetical protein